MNKIDENRNLLEKAIDVVNMFDQANTGCAIQDGLGHRGKLLTKAVNNLRDKINENGKLTILTREQAICESYWVSGQ